MKTLRISLLVFVAFFLAQALSALTVADCFISMPNTLLPTLTEETRKDLVDFQKHKMKAVMPAAFGGKVELSVLTDDYLLLKTSESGDLQLKLLTLSDSSNVLLVMQTVGTTLRDTRVRIYDTQWKPIQRLILPKVSQNDFVNEELVRQKGLSDISARLPLRLFLAYSFEPTGNNLLVVSSLKNDLSLEHRGQVEPCLNDTLKFKWESGQFIRL